MDRIETRETIATACRLLAFLGLVRETTGHVSARVDSEHMLIRCRGSDEAGLAFTRPEAVQLVRCDGAGMSRSAGFETPSELPIHGEMYLARPEVGAVVHAHPVNIEVYVSSVNPRVHGAAERLRRRLE